MLAVIGALVLGVLAEIVPVVVSELLLLLLVAFAELGVDLVEVEGVVVL